jgi:hypothetical protein
LTGTATASAGAVTLNREEGIITTESLSTAAGSDYTLTFTNALIGTASKMQLTIYNGTNTRSPITLRSITYNAGNAVIVIRNDSPAAFNGSLKIEFVVHNQ